LSNLTAANSVLETLFKFPSNHNFIHTRVFLYTNYFRKKAKIQGTHIVRSLNIEYDTAKWLLNFYFTTTIQQTQQVFFNLNLLSHPLYMPYPLLLPLIWLPISGSDLASSFISPPLYFYYSFAPSEL